MLRSPTEFRLVLGAGRFLLIGGSRNKLQRESREFGELQMLPTQLAPALASMASGARRARLKVIVGEPYVRYMVLPWQDGLYTATDWEAYARHQLAEHYSTSTEGLLTAVAHSGYGNPVLAAAIDRQLHASVLAAATAAKVTLRAMVPLLSHCVNRRQNVMRGTSYVTMLLSPGYATCLLIERNVWRGVASLPHIGQSAYNLALDAALQCELNVPKTLYLLDCGLPGASVRLMSGWRGNGKWLGSADSRLWPEAAIG